MGITWTTVRRQLMVIRLKRLFKWIVALIIVLVLVVQMRFSLINKPTQLDEYNFISQREGYINMEVWSGLCLLNFNSLRQYPLFPWQPHERSYLKVRDTLTLNKNGSLMAVRMMGYLHPSETGFYSFHLRSHAMAQLWLSTSGPSNATKVAYTTKNVVNKHSFHAGNPRSTSEGIYLQVDRKYYFEIFQAVNDPLANELEKTNLQWKLPGSLDFVKITGKHVSKYYKLSSHHHKTHRPTNDTVIESSSLEFSEKEDKFTGPFFPLNKTTTTNRRTMLDFKKIKNLLPNPLLHMKTNNLPPYLKQANITMAFPKCLYDPSYMKKTSYKRYEGVWNIRYPLLYPYDSSWNIRWGAPYKNQFYGDDRFDGAVFFKDDEAMSVVQSFMKAIHSKNPGKFQLSSVTNIEKVNDKQRGDRFFLEMVLLRRHDNKLYRVSEFFYRNISQTNLCLLDNLRWNPKVWVNVILNVKNQAAWVIYFIQEMARVLKESREHHVNFVIVDYGNDGIDIGQEMDRQGLKSHTIIKQSGAFHKTSTINMAASHVKDPNSIVLLMDLHLRYPSNFFDKIRKHTIQGKLAFAPILLRLDRCGRPETKHMYSSGFWESLGFGIFSIYKSDWDKFGGMNEKEFKNKWGGEDWEMVDRVLAKGIEIDKLRVPGFYHFFHEKKGMWNT